MTILAYPAAPQAEAPVPGDDLLLKEANHRIANQLTLLAGLIQMESSAVGKGPDLIRRDVVKAMLEKHKNAVVAIGKLHRQLADGPSTEVNLADHLIENTTNLFSALSLQPRPGLRQRLNGDCVVTGEQAQLISLIVGEIIVNSIKHAHPTGIPVQIELGCNRTPDGRILIEIGDDGIGLPEGFDSREHKSLGFSLIHLLSDKLNADLRIESDSLGLSFILLIPRLQ